MECAPDAVRVGRRPGGSNPAPRQTAGRGEFAKRSPAGGDREELAMMDESNASRWMQRAFALTFAVSALAKLFIVKVLLAHLR